MKTAAWTVMGVLILVIVGTIVFFAISGSSDKNNSSVISSATPATDSEATKSINIAAEQPKMKKTYTSAPLPLTKAEIDGKNARIKTKYGDIVIKMSSEAPLAASNFIVLARDGFFDGLTFHRRVEGFVIQGGDPIGNGTGGPGYKFNDEPVNRDYKRGVVAMANSGPNTNGSQFFIMLADNPLPKQYTIFGDVVMGMEVVDKIQVGDTMDKVAIE